MPPKKDIAQLEMKALELVGKASVYATYHKWKQLEKEVLETLKWAYKLNRKKEKPKNG